MVVLPLAAEYLQKVRQGKKLSTVRRGQRNFALGPAVLRAGDLSLKVRITAVKYSTLDQLTDQDALADGFSDRNELMGALRRWYPDITAAEVMTIVRFERL